MSDQQSWQSPSSGGTGPAFGDQAGQAPQYGGGQQQGYPQQGYPQQGHPQQGHPQQGYTQQSYQQPSYPQQGYPQQPYQQGAYQQYQQPMAAPVPSNLAGWGKRVGAYLIDFAPSLVASVVFYIGYVQWIIAATQTTSRSSSVPTSGLAAMGIGSILLLAALGWQIYNRWVTAGRTGQSLGKRVLKIKLVSEQTGQPIGGLNAFARDLVHILDSFFYVGYLWPLWDARKQTFSDKLMKTYVVDAPEAGRS